MIKYQAKAYKDGKRYAVEFPDLPGCFSEGATKEEALENAGEALTLYLEEARDPNWELPSPKFRRSKGYEWVNPDPSVAIPLMIRQARQKLGVSQRELARRLDISVQQLQKLEMPGRSNPTVKTLFSISQALEQSLEIQLVA